MSENIRSRTANEHESDEVRAASRLTQSMERGRVEYNSDGSIDSFDLEGLWRLGTLYAQTSLVPEQYRGKPADCAIAIQMAQRCKVDPMAFMQASFIVHGKPGLETKFALAMLNRSGLIKGPISYRPCTDKEQGFGMQAVVTCNRTMQEIVGPPVTARMVAAEGWDREKKGMPSKWKTMPELMYRYRAAIFLIRTYFPEILFGMQTAEELEDIAVAETAQPDTRQGKGTELRHSASRLMKLAQQEPPPVSDDELAAEAAAESVAEETPVGDDDMYDDSETPSFGADESGAV